MANRALSASQYLAPRKPSCWKWDREGQTVTWSSGETIAFRQELEQVLRKMAPSGLPPLGLVVLVLATCRGSWTQDFSQSSNMRLFSEMLHEAETEEKRRFLDGLLRVSRMPGDLKQPLEAKISLVGYLFESVEAWTSPREAGVICDALLSPDGPRQDWLKPKSAAYPALRPAFLQLLHALNDFDDETFRLRHLTGLDQWLQPAALQAEPIERARELISSLQDDQELGSVARIARALMAVVHLPRPILEPEDLPMGGFSDISNRGPLDRLLVSELAHDNLTLAVRVALNEALYLRRESPPKTPPQGRSILIDVGIRLWGIPRIFATSVAMALAATADPHTAVSTFRALGDRIERANLATRAGLVEQLAALCSEPHPGKALDAFLTSVAHDATSPDCIIITSSEAAADRDFQRELARHQTGSLYVATVDRSGDFQLVRQGRNSHKLVCSAQLVLEDLLRPRSRPTAPLFDGAAGESLPAIFRVVPFPLRVPPTGFNSHRSWVVPAIGLFEIASDGRLLCWDKSGWGPQQLADHVPGKARVCWSDPQCSGGKIVAVIGEGRGTELQMLTLDVRSRQMHLVPLELDNQRYTLSGHGDAIFAVSGLQIRVLDRSNGRCIQTLTVPNASDGRSLVHRRARFFCRPDGRAWYALTYDGTRAHLDTIIGPPLSSEQNLIVTHPTLEKTGAGVHSHAPPDPELLTMFDWVGHEGPIGVTREAELFFPEDGQRRSLDSDVKEATLVSDVSGCGHWLSVHVKSGAYRILRTAGGHAHSQSSSSSLQELEALPWLPPRSVYGLLDRGWLIHRRFTGILYDKRYGCALASKNWFWRILLVNNIIRLERDCRLSEAPPGTTIRPFDWEVPLRGVRYRLKFAAWENGSRAYLDSRGMLHLRSADASLPEVSLVLAEGAIGGWCSDGRFWGPCRFVADARTAETRAVFEEVIQPFFDHLP